MARALVSCPATQTLELIEFANTPLGALLHGCSRFCPTTAMACGRACAAGPRHDLATPPQHDIDPDTELEIACPCEDDESVSTPE